VSGSAGRQERAIQCLVTQQHACLLVLSSWWFYGLITCGSGVGRDRKTDIPQQSPGKFLPNV